MKNAVIYARVSSKGGRKAGARQVDDLLAYAQANCTEVVRPF